MLVSLLLTSCVYTTIDYAYQGRWEASPVAFGGLAETTTIDVRNDDLTITIDGESYDGAYRIIQGDMVIGWDVVVGGHKILLMDAELVYDELWLRYKPMRQYYPITMRLER